MVVLVMCLLVVGPALFVATRCYGDAFQAPMTRPPAARDLPDYVRTEAHTYLGLPERTIVYTADEYAAFLAAEPPSRFPHFAAILQYWGQYDGACQVTSTSYPFEAGYQAKLAALGAALTVEHGLKGFYEKTIGWLTERFQSRETAEDTFATRTAAEHAAFTHIAPGHEFPFGERLTALWTDVPLSGPHLVRKWERRLALTAEYGLKTVFGTLMSVTGSPAYASGNSEISAWIEQVPESVFADRRVARVAAVGPGAYIVRLPRAETFTRLVLELQAKNVRFRSIGGNDDILVSVLVPTGVTVPTPAVRLVSTTPLLTDPSRSRVALGVPVASLHELIAQVQAAGATVEHVYDY
jgi:hypothetical protein